MAKTDQIGPITIVTEMDPNRITVTRAALVAIERRMQAAHALLEVLQPRCKGLSVQAAAEVHKVARQRVASAIELLRTLAYPNDLVASPAAAESSTSSTTERTPK